ncbi:unnamed protein product [Polarella glacialis]|uniref:Tetratricopeptide SHNi-TPR domain-containing protein n=1 Tax=Polarella glacialis TaxID=89957 RepID=A0A813H1C5_POLGL|nr:unnamed protein product [Polarella glacialis]
MSEAQAGNAAEEAQSKLLHLQALRRKDPEAAAEALAEEVGRQAEILGTDVHPALGQLWFEYGDTLLELVEFGDSGEPKDDADEEEVGEAEDGEAEAGKAEVGEADETADGNSEPHGDDVDGDLQLAWECLETARRCLELRSAAPEDLTALSRTHGRLADLLLIQARFDEAVEESRACLDLCRRARASRASKQEGRIEEAEAEEEEEEALAAVRLGEALRRSRREATGEAQGLASEGAVMAVSRDSKSNASQVGRILQSSIGFGPSALTSGSGVPILEVPVRRKRPREEQEKDFAEEGERSEQKS